MLNLKLNKDKRSEYFQYLLTPCLVLILLLTSGCITKGKIEVTIKKPKKIISPTTIVSTDVTVTNIKVVNHQIIITGTNLSDIKNFVIKEGTNSTSLEIESQSTTSLVANTITNVTFAAGRVFDFILSSATASTTFTVNFSLCDSLLGGKGINCTVAPNDKEVLSFDAVSGKWKPRAVNGLSYQGTWDASGSFPSVTGVGDYFIVNVANGIYHIGDWIVFNGTSYDKIDNSNAILSVYGRTGAIVATKGDYTLTKMADVDLTTTPPTTGQYLKYNGTNWVPSTVVTSSGTVTSVTGTSPIAVATGTTTPVVSISQATGTVNGYLSAADWTTFNAKQASITAGTTAQYYRGDKTFVTLDTSVVPENTNLYFTNARALGVPLTGFNSALTGAVTATDTVLQAFGRIQNQITTISGGSGNFLIKNAPDTLSGAVALTGVITASGTGDIIVSSVPLGMTSAVNKTYADGKLDKTAGGTVAGVVTFDNDLKIKGGSNYVTVKGHATSANYNFVLPINAGTNGYLLSTDGSGNTSWIAAAGGTVTSANITDGTIVDADINASAAIAESKIANLITDLAAKQTTTLTNGNILVGNGSNVATSVAMSGDATLANTGAVTLKNTGTAGTYTSVTTDAQGRVTAGTNPVVVTSITGTAPVTIGGTAAVPVISMAAATNSVNGYLTSTDWNTFNGKQTAINAASTLNTGSITTNLQGGVVVNPFGVAAGETGEVRFNELVANGTNYVALKSPDALAANVTYTLPAADGSAGQILKTNGSGVLSWVTDNAGAGAFSGTINKAVATDGAGALTTVATSATELGYVAGVTSAIQTQLNAKQTTSLTNGNFLVGNGSSVATGVAMSGDATLASTGAVTLNTVTVAKGGTGLTAGTSGGVPYFNSTSTIASSGLLTANGVVLGGGAGAAPTTTAAGTADQVLRIPAAGGAPAFGAIDLTKAAAVTGALPIANGGTGATSQAAAQTALGILSAGLTATGDITGNIPLVGTGGIVANNLCTGATSGGGISCSTANTSAGLAGFISDETGSGLLVFGTAPTISNPVIANIAPAADFTLTQNSVVPFTSVNTGAVVNTLYLKAGQVGVGTTTPGSALDVKGTIRLSGSTSGYVGLAPAAAAGSTTYTLPASDGTGGYVLSTNGSGTMSWVANGAGGAPLASPAFTGVPTAPTAAANTNTTQLATTAFVMGQAGLLSPVAGSSSITTVGTISSGTWNGTAVTVPYGGTGATTLTTNGILYGNGTSAVNATAAASTPSVLLSTITTNVPAWTTSTTGNFLQGSASGVVFGPITNIAPGTDFTISQNSVVPFTSVNAGAIANTLYLKAGQVGVGTTSPGAALDVKGTIRLSGSTSGYVGFAPAAAAGSTVWTLPAVDSTGSQYLKSDGAGNLSWGSPTGTATQWTTTGSDIYYNTGKVGVGTATPAYAVDVAGVIRSSSGGIQFPDGSVMTTAAATSVGSSSTTNLSFVADSDANGSGDVVFSTLALERMRITNAGRVGIGIAAPSSILHVATDPGVDSTITLGQTLRGTLMMGTQGAGAVPANNVITSDAGGPIIFKRGSTVGDLSTGTEVMRISGSAQQVGINNSSPGSTLDVKGIIRLTGSTSGYTGFAPAAAAGSTVWTLPTADGTAGQFLKTDGAGTLSWVTGNAGTLTGSGTTNYIPYYSSATGLANSPIAISGSSVGVGTTSPGFVLDVNGSIAATGALQAHSDRRLKKNIVNVDNSLEKLEKINGVYFDWRKDEFPKIKFEGGRQLGVIAQDVEKVFPEAVAVNHDGIRSVAYTMLIAPLIEAVKVLYHKFLGHDEVLATQGRRIASAEDQKADKAVVEAKVRQLENENKIKEQKIKMLESRLERIEKAQKCTY